MAKYRIYRQGDTEMMHLGSGLWLESRTLITQGDTLSISNAGTFKVVEVMHHLGTGDDDVITDLYVVPASINTNA